MHKQTLLSALSYPRFHIRNNLAQRNCPYHNDYLHNERVCCECLYQEECCWVGRHDSDSKLTHVSTVELSQMLEFTVEYVQTDVAFWGHDTRHCGCEACRWLRATWQLLQPADLSYH